PLTELNPSAWEALIMPGGFGAAKNLCNFASRGSQGVVCAELLQLMRPMYEARKPIGAVCITPAIVALAFPRAGIELTLGARSEAAQEIEKLGQKHIECPANGFHVDRTHRIVSTPAYMYDAA